MMIYIDGLLYMVLCFNYISPNKCYCSSVVSGVIEVNQWGTDFGDLAIWTESMMCTRDA